MSDTTTGHAEAVKAVTGQSAPETPQEQVDDGAIVTTRDLDSEQKSTEKLMAETEKGLAKASGDTEQKQRFVHTLENGKTEAVLESGAAGLRFPPDDGGYNPEKRTHAGPAGTMTPQSADAHRQSQAVTGEVPTGFKESDRVGKK